MKGKMKKIAMIVSAMIVIAPIITTTFNNNLVSAAGKSRVMEDLGRGVVAVRNGEDVFISWRLLALDSSGIGFNIYRSSAEGTAVKLNSEVLTKGTNYLDTTADLTRDNTYFVKPIINGKEQSASEAFTIKAYTASEPAVVVPINSGGKIGNLWVGDFDGDHEYDFLVSRNRTETQTLEAYKRDGSLLWSMDLGPNSSNQDNISPGSTAIDTGMWDGVTVYDLDGDGKSEVVLRIANGVTFGDGEVWSTTESDDKQWLAVVDGMTGTLKQQSPLPDDYIAQGPLALQLGIGYLNGSTPSVVAFMKNRNEDRSFNLVIAAYHYANNNLTMDWNWKRNSPKDASDGHQMRIIDIDHDGKDEIAEIGFMLNGDGTLRYSLYDQNVRHGDRFYIGQFNPNSTKYYGYGIQQDNIDGVLEYYYDASTGEMLWQHTTTPPAPDVGRGDVGDIDPRYPGYETWSFSGIYNGPTDTQITPAGSAPWPAIRMWWDGDLLSESLNESKLEKWNYETNSVDRLLTTYKHHNSTLNYRKAPIFYGDVLGDWREEIIMTNNEDYSQLIIFTTDIPTDIRLYTLAQNPAYRNSMTIKGYIQSHLTDYYLGEGMSTPAQPNIVLAP
ncbi:hypothetical protein [Paenibacillus illinoisensis]|uniref:rhamnogalacturonan lyase family protein n=1 Tax=Paenibacillus illinoisensis TaxID=59845 RepID=UPI003CF6F190